MPGAINAAPVRLVAQQPEQITQLDPGRHSRRLWTRRLWQSAPDPAGRCRRRNHGSFRRGHAEGRINRKPPGTVRYNRTTLTLRGAKPVVAAPPADKRNTEQVSDAASAGHPDPAGVGRGAAVPLGRDRRLAGRTAARSRSSASPRSAATWDDDAAAFDSSDEMLNRIWELCRYSIKATTFAGVYVDGDRERIPYEADAYLNQLSHYCTDNDMQMARDTFDHLMKHGTWPTEWAPHMVFMAHADWMHTGDTRLARPALRGAQGETPARAGRARRPDHSAMRSRSRGPTSSTGRRASATATSSPRSTPCERLPPAGPGPDGRLARALGKDAEAKDYVARARATHAVFQEKLFDAGAGDLPRRRRHRSLLPALQPLPARLRAGAGGAPGECRRLGGGTRHGLLGLCRAIPARGPVRKRRRRTRPSP